MCFMFVLAIMGTHWFYIKKNFQVSKTVFESGKIYSKFVIFFFNPKAYLS